MDMHDFVRKSIISHNLGTPVIEIFNSEQQYCAAKKDAIACLHEKESEENVRVITGDGIFCVLGILEKTAGEVVWILDYVGILSTIRVAAYCDTIMKVKEDISIEERRVA